MIQLSQLTVQQLERAVAIKQQIESLQAELDCMDGAGNGVATPKRGPGRPKGVKIDGRIEGLKKARAARLAKLAAKQEGSARPATQETPVSEAGGKKKSTISTLRSEAAKARWAKIKAVGQAKL